MARGLRTFTLMSSLQRTGMDFVMSGSGVEVQSKQEGQVVRVDGPVRQPVGRQQRYRTTSVEDPHLEKLVHQSRTQQDLVENVPEGGGRGRRRVVVSACGAGRPVAEKSPGRVVEEPPLLALERPRPFPCLPARHD